MVARQRIADVGAAKGRAALLGLGREERIARLDRGLSLDDVGRNAGISGSMVSRFERGLSPDVGVVRASVLLAVVGLDLSARAYPGGSPIRDAAHGALLRRFHARLHRTIEWATEAPLPLPGDRRAWDGLIGSHGWRYGVEAETHPTDGQALGRRLELKRRDGGADGIILVLPDTRHVRLFLAAAGDLLRPAFPVPGRRALELLAAGVDPGGSAIVVI